MRIVILLITLGLAAPPAFSAEKPNEILLTFSGVLKSMSKKEIVIQPEADNDMTFVRTKHTRFVRNGHKTNDARIPKGSAVRIDSVQKLDGELEAVTVTVTDAAPPDSSK